MAPTALNKAANLWVSRIIPVILVGLVGYVTWVVIVLICGRPFTVSNSNLPLRETVKYLLQTPNGFDDPRHGAAITILVLYSLLFIMMVWTYLRLLYTVATNPGYVPRGSQWYTQHGRCRSKHLSSGGSVQEKDREWSRAETPGGMAQSFKPSEEFFTKETYVCKGDGMPVWCSTCMIWKPDRAHHCREVERCVRKMDHFCPWVGGVVSETCFNFFVQFTAWSLVFCIFNVVHIAVFIAEYRRLTGTANVHWIITLGLAALFALFTLGMTGSSLQLILVNSTTIENLSRKSIVWDLAVRVPEVMLGTISLPTVSFSPSQVIPSETANAESDPNTVRKYVILHSRPGESPWDLGAFRNFQSVMGLHWYQWLFPLSYSPCCDHAQPESQFEMGPVLHQMKKDAGLIMRRESISEKSQQRRRHRRKRRRRRNPTPDAVEPEASLKESEWVGQGNGVRDVADMV